MVDRHVRFRSSVDGSAISQKKKGWYAPRSLTGSTSSIDDPSSSVPPSDVLASLLSVDGMRLGAAEPTRLGTAEVTWLGTAEATRLCTAEPKRLGTAETAGLEWLAGVESPARLFLQAFFRGWDFLAMSIDYKRDSS